MAPLPLVRAEAPGRVNLIGEHLDYNGGRCLPIAIDRRTRVRVTRSPDDLTRVPTEHGGDAYVLAVLAALGVRVPLEIRISSTVPIGAGLSSSAALTCAVAVAVDATLARGLSREDLAAACIEAENSVGAPTGGMDQAAALFGVRGHALLLDFADGSRTPVPWRPEAAGLTLLVVDTGVAHAHAAGDYAARRAACERAAASLGVTHLAHAGDVESLPDDLRPIARHVVGEQARVAAFLDALAAEEWAEVGALMTASHASLRDDFAVSCAELDAVVEAALEAGAAGARMTGGGFGGAAIALVPTGRIQAVTDAVRAHPVWDGSARNSTEAPTLFRVEASAGAEVVQIT